jgi:hypothetical protein
MVDQLRPPGPTGATVVVPRNLLIGLGAGLGVALLALAFLLGRETGPRSKGVAAPSSATASTQELQAPAFDPGRAMSLPPGSARTEARATEAPRADAGIVTGPGISTTHAAVDPNVRAAVTRYFGELDAIEAVAKTWSDPEQLAMEIVQQTATGDSHGLDALVATQRQARERLRAVAVPDVCREHHAQVEALMDDAIGMLNRVKQATASGDLDALQAIATTAHELEAKTKRLDALALSLKQRYVSAG